VRRGSHGVSQSARHPLAHHVDEERLSKAIQTAEAATTGTIEIALVPRFFGDVHRAAQHAFKRMAVGHAAHHNGILFFIVPSRRRFAVIGGKAIHERAGQEFWHRIVREMREALRSGDLTHGLERGIREAGEELALHFPRRGG
jgi:uncharacterized membrane protein